MGARVNPNWIKRIVREYKESKNKEDFKLDEVLSYNPATQWLVSYLTKNGVAYKIINLGAGVKRITTDVKVCSKCNGTGRC